MPDNRVLNELLFAANFAGFETSLATDNLLIENFENARSFK